VYQYTLECVKALFDKGCSLVVLACNTASAKALRSIQQNDLPSMPGHYKVLGVIRPTTEIIGQYTHSQKVGILGTPGTVSSESYPIEIKKFFPNIEVFQEACPMWVPLVESNEFQTEGADYFIKQNIDSLLSKNPDIDVIVLACTHYPLLIKKIKNHLPPHIKVVSQGEIVASSLKDYLTRHPEIETRCSKNNNYQFYTTDDPSSFDPKATIFFGKPVKSMHLKVSASY
jgi:glutamate racemase